MAIIMNATLRNYASSETHYTSIISIPQFIHLLCTLYAWEPIEDWLTHTTMVPPNSSSSLSSSKVMEWSWFWNIGSKVCANYIFTVICVMILLILTNVFINLPQLLIVNAGSDRHLKPQQIIPVSTDAEMALNTPNCTISDLSCNSAGYLCLETSSSDLLLLSMGI